MPSPTNVAPAHPPAAVVSIEDTVEVAKAAALAADSDAIFVTDHRQQYVGLTTRAALPASRKMKDIMGPKGPSASVHAPQSTLQALAASSALPIALIGDNYRIQGVMEASGSAPEAAPVAAPTLPAGATPAAVVTLEDPVDLAQQAAQAVSSDAVFATDHRQQYCGWASTDDLAQSNQGAKVKDVLRPKGPIVAASAPATSLAALTSSTAAPIALTDDNYRIIGALSGTGTQSAPAPEPEQPAQEAKTAAHIMEPAVVMTVEDPLEVVWLRANAAGTTSVFVVNHRQHYHGILHTHEHSDADAGAKIGDRLSAAGPSISESAPLESVRALASSTTQPIAVMSAHYRIIGRIDPQRV